jgi:hypothetical protein
MHRFSYKTITMDELIKLFSIKNENAFKEGVDDLINEGYNEKSIKYALTKPPVQQKLYSMNDSRIRSILINEVRKNAYKTNDPRWEQVNQRKFEAEMAEKTRREMAANRKVDNTKEKDAKGFIYFIQAINGGPVKIGFSICPEKRMSELQTANPYKLDLIGSIKGNVFAEKKLHRHLIHARTFGEWFEPDEVVIETIKQCLEHGYDYIKKLE